MYGASLRNLFLYADRQDTYNEIITSEINQLSPTGLTELLFAGRTTSGSHYLMTTGPLPNDRSRPERKIASPYVFAEFCRLILGDRVEMMKGCYDKLHLTPTTFSATGMVFKYRAHQFLQEGRTLEIFPILASSEVQGAKHLKYVYNRYTDNVRQRQQFILPRLDLCPVDKDTQRTHELGVYYCSRSPTFPSVDSWVLVQPNPREPPIVLAFQMTINKKEHDAKPSSLDWLRMLVPLDAKVYHVILTPEAVEPEINVSADYLTTTFLGGRGVNDAFPVFHCEIGIVELFKPRVT